MPHSSNKGKGVALPTGPPRKKWSGTGVRKAASPGGQHDCFSADEILQLAQRSSFFQETEWHLLGGLASGCEVCWAAIDKVQHALKFPAASGPEVELLRILTFYPPETLPLTLRKAVEKVRGGGVVGILALLVESMALLCWDDPRRLLDELEDARALMGSEDMDGWNALNARIDTYCARAWLRVADLTAEERLSRAGVALETALLHAKASGDRELLAVAMAARSELDPGGTEAFLREAIEHLRPGESLRAELLCELAACLSGERLTEALAALLQAVAETESLAESFPETRLNALHYTAATAAKLAQQERHRAPFSSLYFALAGVAHSLSESLLGNYPSADKGMVVHVLNLGLFLMVAMEGCRTVDELEESWGQLSDGDDSAPGALELLWIADRLGFMEFLDTHLEIAKRRWCFSSAQIKEPVLALQSAARGSAIDKQVLTPFLTLAERLERAN